MKGGVAAAVAAALRFVAARPFAGLDQLSHHRRRGRPGGQRHGQAARLGARQGRAIRPLHPRRADQRQRARRHDQERPARLADRRGSRSTASRAMSPIRISRRIRSARSRRCLRRSSRRRSIRATPTFEPSNLEIVSVDVGNPAANVIPGEVRLVFNVRFNDRWTPRIARSARSSGGSRRRPGTRARRSPSIRPTRSPS